MGEALEKAIARLAHRQRGCLTRRQLLALGLSPGAIQHRVSTGWLIKVFRGVYAVGHLPVTPEDRAAAAVLACGPKAVLSHHSALCLWGWAKSLMAPFHVTTSTRHRVPGIRVHESTSFTRNDIRAHLGIRVTSPARTVLDVAPGLTDEKLRRAVREARLSRRLKPGDLEDVVFRFPRHRGAQRLSAFVNAPRAPTRSEFEDAFIAFCAEYGLPTPRTNVRIGPYVVDAFFEEEQLIVELDGYEYHGDRFSYEGDRDRDADNLLAGLPTVRITWERMTGTPAREADRLLRILEARRRR